MVGRRLLWGLLALPVCATAQAEDRIRVASEGSIRNAWTLAPGTKLPVPAYPKAYDANPAETCVAIGYLLNPDGTTSDFALLKAWSAAEPKKDQDAFWAAFAQGASQALAYWKFIPRQEVSSPQPVYTAATFVFASPDMGQTRKRCAIPDLSMRLVELRHDTKARRKMAGKTIFDRLDIDPLLEQRYRKAQQIGDGAMRSDMPAPRQEEPERPPSPPPSDGG